MVKQRKPIHHFDRRETLIVVIVFVGMVGMYTFWEPSGQIVAKNAACNGDVSNSFCDYAYNGRCEAGCSDCNICLSHCTDVCAAQGKFVDYCRDNYYCACTDQNPCVR